MEIQKWYMGRNDHFISEKTSHIYSTQKYAYDDGPYATLACFCMHRYLPNASEMKLDSES